MVVVGQTVDTHPLVWYYGHVVITTAATQVTLGSISPSAICCWDLLLGFAEFMVRFNRYLPRDLCALIS